MRKSLVGALLMVLTPACSDTSGPDFLDVEVTVTWDRLDDAGFVGDRYMLIDEIFGGADDTLAVGLIPPEGSPFVIRAPVPCPIAGIWVSARVWGHYDGRSDEQGCKGRAIVGRIDSCSQSQLSAAVDGSTLNWEFPTGGEVPGVGVGCTPPGG